MEKQLPRTSYRGRVRAAKAACIVLGLLFFSTGIQGQSGANGQGAPAGTQNRNGANTPCGGQDAATANNDSNCSDFGPNFAAPSAGILGGNRPLPVISVVRVEAVVAKPPITLPPGVTFDQVGSVTMVKTRRETADACLAAGKRWSVRSSAASSTTCLNQKGDVLAFQECKPSSGSADCMVVMAQDAAK